MARWNEPLVFMLFSLKSWAWARICFDTFALNARYDVGFIFQIKRWQRAWLGKPDSLQKSYRLPRQAFISSCLLLEAAIDELRYCKLLRRSYVSMAVITTRRRMENGSSNDCVPRRFLTSFRIFPNIFPAPRASTASNVSLDRRLL